MKAKEEHEATGMCPMFEFRRMDDGNNYDYENREYYPAGTTYPCSCCKTGELLGFLDEDYN